MRKVLQEQKKTILANYRGLGWKKVSKKKNMVLLYDIWCKLYCNTEE